jgi:HK97 family phage major capsid protein
MPPTKREQLERLVDDMQAMADAADAKGEFSAQDRQKMVAMMADSKRLSEEIKIEHGLSHITDAKELVAALNRPDGSGTNFLAAMSGSGGAGAKSSGPWATEMKNFLDRIGSKALVPSGTITVPSLSTTLTTATDRPRSLLQLIPFEKLEGTDTFSFLRETVRTHAASTVAAGALKPTSVYSVAKIEDRVRTVASLSEPVDRALLADVSLLGQYLEGALKEGVLLELEDQVLNGNTSTTGVLDDMTGIRYSTPGTQAFGTDALTTARKAATQLENLNIDMSGVAWVMTPLRWETFELLTSATDYVLGDPGRGGSTVPVDRARRSLWGYPVVTSTAMIEDFAILGDWRGSVRIYEREGVRVDWSDAVVSAGTSGFEKNQINFRAEGRWGLAVLKPAAFVVADLVA